MSSATHRIRRLTWQVRTPSTVSALARRQALRENLELTLLPAIDRAFETIAPGPDLIRIPRLTVHLQLREGADFGDEFSQLLEVELAAALREIVVLSGASGAPTSTPIEPRHDSDGFASITDARRIGVNEYRRAVLMEYLASGRLDWSAATSETIPLIEWLKQTAEHLAVSWPDVAELFSETWATRHIMYFRWLQLLPSATRETLLRKQTAGRGDVFDRTLRHVAITLDFDEFTRLRAAALLLAREKKASPLQNSTGAQLLAEVASRLAVKHRADSELVRAVEALIQGLDLNRVSPDLRTDPRSRTALRSIQDLKQDPATLSSEDSGRFAANPPQPVVDDASRVDDIAWRVMALESPATFQTPGTLSDDAGLIIVHPFLTRLFNTTDIVSLNSRVLPETTISRAAALLHWLATGRNEVFEFELSLIKVLLGLSPHDPLAVSNGLLTDRDRAEGDTMLEAAVEHWPALKKTSIAGFRASFMQRRGILRATDRGWHLQVEPKSFDMLLGQLPWGISIVKLPWMPKPIFTEWPTP